jgi:hypothetical protein
LRDGGGTIFEPRVERAFGGDGLDARDGGGLFG